MSGESREPFIPAALAAALREAREARGLDLEEAARQCLLSASQVACLESGDHGAFYSPDYARRAARRYAAWLGLAELADRLGPAATPPVAASVAAAPLPAIPQRLSVPVMPRRRGTLNLLLVLAGAGVVATIVLVQHLDRPGAGTGSRPAATAPRQDAPARPGPVAPPTGAPSVETVLPAPQVSAASAPLPVEPPRRSPRRFYVLAIRGTPLSLRDATGRVLYDGVVGPGFSRSFEGEPPFRVEASAPDPLEVYYLGRRVRLQDTDGGRATAGFGEVARTAR